MSFVDIDSTDQFYCRFADSVQIHRSFVFFSLFAGVLTNQQAYPVLKGHCYNNFWSKLLKYLMKKLFAR